MTISPLTLPRFGAVTVQNENFDAQDAQAFTGQSPLTPGGSTTSIDFGHGHPRDNLKWAQERIPSTVNIRVSLGRADFVNRDRGYGIPGSRDEVRLSVTNPEGHNRTMVIPRTNRWRWLAGKPATYTPAQWAKAVWDKAEALASKSRSIATFLQIKGDELN
ncbi:MAG: hypothetical protein KC475_10005 [Cyanobacteria bacterium HKST-UBA03]|nr:hypothetical protein [Cyanobacteria bacterium HKST-UBA03]